MNGSVGLVLLQRECVDASPPPPGFELLTIPDNSVDVSCASRRIRDDVTLRPVPSSLYDWRHWTLPHQRPSQRGVRVACAVRSRTGKDVAQSLTSCVRVRRTSASSRFRGPLVCLPRHTVRPPRFHRSSMILEGIATNEVHRTVSKDVEACIHTERNSTIATPFRGDVRTSHFSVQAARKTVSAGTADNVTCSMVMVQASVDKTMPSCNKRAWLPIVITGVFRMWIVLQCTLVDALVCDKCESCSDHEVSSRSIRIEQADCDDASERRASTHGARNVAKSDLGDNAYVTLLGRTLGGTTTVVSSDAGTHGTIDHDT